ncbi:MAG: asparagine synthase (glutamine-hydrolyzing) [Chloroflexi bacterium]|nr:asparagine synthase (glutamine-hydrolyzing) [Chloroflexota bacterium]
MCGIAGVLDLTSNHPPDRATLECMSARIIHRGPDDDGYLIEPPVGLAVRRLSIVDVAGGHMPLANEDQSVWIVHNGEIYNAPELRDELRARGHRFSTRGDTEVIVHAYEQWGDESITRLRGMFAIALWDVRRQRLVLARDRWGVKPLYFAQANGRLAFASEVVPALLGAGLSPQADLVSLEYLFDKGYLPAPRTMFTGVQSLAPAHLMVVERGLITKKRYWTLDFPRRGDHARASAADASEQFLSHLRDAVKMRLMSDVPIGALLSGGLDSSSLVALLQELSGGRTATFSIGFAAESHDEARAAQLAADALGTEHHTLQFDMSDFALWPRIIRHMESPQCSATSIPLYRLYQACHEAGYKVILTGEGADELLGGYHWFSGDARVRRWLWLPRSVRVRMAQAAPNGSEAGRRVLAEGTANPRDRYFLWTQATCEAERAALFAGIPMPEPYDHPPAPFRGSPVARGTGRGGGLYNLAALDQFLYLDSHTRLPNFINDEVDRMSMAHSVEARVPFLDHRLWEFAAALPPNLKLGRGAFEKQLLRSAMQGRLPEEIRLRRKQGLTAPHALFWRQAQLPAFAADAMSVSALKETGYFNPDAVTTALAAHRGGSGDHSRLLTGVLTTQLWHDLFLR